MRQKQEGREIHVDMLDNDSSTGVNTRKSVTGMQEVLRRLPQNDFLLRKNTILNRFIM